MYVIWWVSDGFLALPSNLAVTSVAFEAVAEEDNIVEQTCRGRRHVVEEDNIVERVVELA